GARQAVPRTRRGDRAEEGAAFATLGPRIVYPLATLLLAHGSLAKTVVPSEALEKELEALYDAARSTSPEGTSVAAADFVGYLAERVTRRDDELSPEFLPSTITNIRTSDLYLACACSRGDARAIAIFDARFLSEVDRALRRSQLSASAIDDTKQ